MHLLLLVREHTSLDFRVFLSRTDRTHRGAEAWCRCQLVPSRPGRSASSRRLDPQKETKGTPDVGRSAEVPGMIFFFFC